MLPIQILSRTISVRLLPQSLVFQDLKGLVKKPDGDLQVWEGNGVVASARKLIGATNPLNAEPGTIRGDLCIQTGRNIVHGSDSGLQQEDGLRLIQPRRRYSFQQGFMIYAAWVHLDVRFSAPTQCSGISLSLPSLCAAFILPSRHVSYR